jgi:hypothetical protein
MNADLKKILKKVLSEQTASSEPEKLIQKNGLPFNPNFQGIPVENIKMNTRTLIWSDVVESDWMKEDCEGYINAGTWKNGLDACIRYQQESIASSTYPNSVWSFDWGSFRFTPCSTKNNQKMKREFSGYYGVHSKGNCYAPLYGYTKTKETKQSKEEGGTQLQGLFAPIPDM